MTAQERSNECHHIAVPEEHKPEYLSYIRELYAIVKLSPIQLQQYLNKQATGWHGDPYALVQRQARLAQDQ